jgi:corrinoid protein of di/trimethylamine methyltransferase
MHKDLFKKMAQSIIDGEVETATDLAIKALNMGIDPLTTIHQGFIPGVDYVGDRFSCGEMYLPELVGAGEAMKAAIAVLEPEMTKRGQARNFLATVVIGTVEGDIHDIGKTLVATMLSANGFKVYDMGVDVPIQSFVTKVKEVKANILGISALLTTTMVKQRDVVKALEESGLRAQVKILVGGAPVNQTWATEIGADGYSEDAMGAIHVAKKVLGL